jgi:flagellar capping protein FliD
VNGQTATGTNGDLTVTGDGPAQGLKLHIAPGATGDLGTVGITQGLFGILSDITNAALSSGGGGVQGEIDNLNNSLTSMQQQVSLLQQQAQKQTLALTQQFGAAQATLSQLSTVSNFLSTYFDQLSNSSGS